MPSSSSSISKKKQNSSSSSIPLGISSQGSPGPVEGISWAILEATGWPQEGSSMAPRRRPLDGSKRAPREDAQEAPGGKVAEKNSQSLSPLGASWGRALLGQASGATCRGGPHCALPAIPGDPSAPSVGRGRRVGGRLPLGSLRGRGVSFRFPLPSSSARCAIPCVPKRRS